MTDKETIKEAVEKGSLRFVEEPFRIGPPQPRTTGIDAFSPVACENPKDAVGSAKPPLSCVSGAVLLELGAAMYEGARKYGRHNYRLAPIRQSIYYDAMMRHLIRYWEGEDIDPDSGVHHVTKIMACCAVLRDAMITGKTIDDRPPKLDPKFYAEVEDLVRDLIEQYPNARSPVTQVQLEEKA